MSHIISVLTYIFGREQEICVRINLYWSQNKEYEASKKNDSKSISLTM
jgi:hypothetical protein